MNRPNDSRIRTSRQPGKRGKSRPAFLIREDLKYPGRVYFAAPPTTSLSPEDAIALANRLTDVMEKVEASDT